MRKSGILLPLFSLPGKYGIGTMGKQAYGFIDFLNTCSQYYWQILPLNPTSYSNSPYEATSVFAGNPFFIDPDLLFEMGLLSKEDLTEQSCIQNERVDYAFLRKKRLPLIEKAAARLSLSENEKELFKKDNVFWLEDYCFFTALKKRNNMRPLLKPAKQYAHLKAELKDETELQLKVQYLFFLQWKSLREYAKNKGVHIIGDIPIYVSEDSSDFFAHRELFCCDEIGNTTKISGCPPDAFSVNGQLWGHPLYDWQNKKEQCLCWWEERFNMAVKLFDCIRIDHFRGFYEYYSIPVKNKDASFGKWEKGPAEDFVSMLKSNFPFAEIIAEDLGFITPEVKRFFSSSGYPGMKILQFAFDEENSDHLPHNHTKNSVCYTGTHDNPTVLSWLCQSSREAVNRALDYFGAQRVSQLSQSFIMGAMSSVCDTAIIPLQDYMDIGCKGRINTPGTEEGNWEYRLDTDYATDKLTDRILYYTKTYSRNIKEEI